MKNLHAVYHIIFLTPMMMPYAVVTPIGRAGIIGFLLTSSSEPMITRIREHVISAVIKYPCSHVTSVASVGALKLSHDERLTILLEDKYD